MTENRRQQGLPQDTAKVPGVSACAAVVNPVCKCEVHPLHSTAS